MIELITTISANPNGIAILWGVIALACIVILQAIKGGGR
jgi:hypothetical protein